MQVEDATDHEAIDALVKAGDALEKLFGVYSDHRCGITAGRDKIAYRRFADTGIGRSVELLKALQKKDPTFVRFTVDRMGDLAYVKLAGNARVG